MFLTHALRAIYRAVVAAVTGDALWKYVTLLISGTPPAVTFISDASTNGNVLTLNGDTRPSNFNPYTPGYYSNYFDGTGDYLTFPSNAAFVFGTGDFTIELWVNQQNWNPSGGAYYSHWISINSYLSGIMVRPNTTGTGIQVYVGGTDYLFSTTLSLNTWFHVAVSRSSSSMRVFVNGTQIGATQTVSYNISTNTSNAIGTAVHDTSEEMQGYLSNVRVLKGTGLYAANFTPSTAPLTAIAGTSLLTCQSNRLIDNSLNNFVITKTGDTTVSGFTPFTPPTSVTVNNLYSTYFDGTGDYLSVPTSTNLNLTADFTVEMWANATATTNAADQVFNYGNFIFMLYHVGTTWTVEVGNGTSNLFTLSGTASLNAWHHFAITRSGNTYTFWIDGVSAATTTNTNAPSTSGSTLYIGRRSSNNDQYFTGYISNFRIIKGTGLYTIPFPNSVPTAPLTAIANTSLLTCQNSTLIDNSTNAFAITSAGDARPVAQSPFTQTTTTVPLTTLGSTYFDGTGDYLSVTGAINYSTSNFTVEGWIYPSTAAIAGSAIRIIQYQNGTATSNFAWAVYMTTSTIFGAVVSGSTSTSATNLGPNNLIANTWNHFAVVRNSTSLQVFANGIGGTVVVCPATINNPAGALHYIGSDTTTANYNGYISNLRVVNGTAVYTANFDVPTQPLTAVTNTQLLTFQTNQPAANKQFVDNSGNNFLITQAGNTTQGTFSPYGANWSNYFDATGDYLNTPSNVAFAFGTGDYTVECWAYPIPAGKISRLFQYSDNVDGIEVNSNAGTYAVGYINYYNGSGSTASSTAVVSNNAWSHIAVVRLSGTVRVYVNGVLALTQATTPNTTTARSLAIGGSSSDATFFSLFYGYISNCRVVKGTAVYLTAFPSTVPTAPLTPITNTSLLTCQSPSLIDNSPNAFAITKVGDTSVQRFSPFSPVTQTPQTYSGYFDGTGDYLSVPANTAFDFRTGDFTIECWIYAPTGIVDFTDTIISKGQVGFVDYANWAFQGTTTGGNINFFGPASITYATTTTQPWLTGWVHLAMSRSGSNTRCFLNGTQVGSTYTVLDDFLAGNPLIIGGGFYDPPGRSFKGYISNVRLVKGTGLYTTTFIPSTTPLTTVSNTSILTCQSPTFIDNSTNAFAMTAVGDSTPRAYNPFGYTNTTTGTAYTPALYGGSGYFDGTGDILTIPSNEALNPNTGAFTIEMWIYPLATVSGAGLFTAAPAGADTRYSITYYGTTGLGFARSTAWIAYTSTVPAINSWSHLAVSRDATGAVRLFLNGVAQTLNGTANTTVTDTGTFLTTAMQIGYWAGYFNGYISNVRMVKGTDLYKGSFVPPIAPLTATAGTTLLLNMDKGAAVDSSRINDLETVGDAKVTYETPYAGSYYSNFFDGTGDYLTAPSNIALAFGTGDYTMECWIYPTTTNYGRIFEFSSNSDNVDIDMSTGAISYYNGVGSTSSASGVIRVNSWSHIALVRSSGTAKIYVNGVLALTQPVTPNTTIARVLYIAGASNLLFAGYISNLRVVKGTALYTANFTPPTTPLTAIANTSLLTCQSKSFVDNSSNNFTLTRNGDVAVKSQNPFRKNSGSSIYLDGTGDYLKGPISPVNQIGSGDYTFECWVNANGLAAAKAGEQTLITYGANGFLISIWTGNVHLAQDNVADKTDWASTAVASGTWFHLAVCRSGASNRCFVNGVQAGSTYTDSTNYTGTTSIYFGANSAGTTAFNGYIADLRITKSARYTGTFPLPTEPLLTS